MVVTRRLSVLVTGAGGFVGRTLCPYLEAEGFAVRRISRHAEGIGRIEHIGPETDWREALRGIEAVVHLAGLAHVPDGSAEEGQYHRVNALGTRRLAEAAVQAGVKRVVFVSSATVMGVDSGEHLWREQDKPAPANAYAQSKLDAESMLREVAERGGMDWVALRPPLVYGPEVKANFLSLLGLAAMGLPLPLARLRNHRRLLALPNLCAAVSLTLLHPGASRQVFFVGDDEEVSTPELLRRVASALNASSRLWPFPPSWLGLAFRLLGKPGIYARLSGNFRFSDEAFRTYCGWKPPVTMDEALRQTADWYRNRGETA